MSVVTPPAALPLTAAEVRAHLRIPHTAEDTQIDAMIAAAVGEIDAPQGWLGRSLITRTLRLTLDAPPSSLVYLPGPPVTEVKTIHYRDEDDAFVKIYDVDDSTDTIGLQSDLTSEPALIWPSDDIGWPSGIKCGPDCVRIAYAAGYDDADAVPRTARQWLLMRVGELYRDREASMLGVPSTRLHHADRMLDSLRVRA